MTEFSFSSVEKPDFHFPENLSDLQDHEWARLAKLEKNILWFSGIYKDFAKLQQVYSTGLTKIAAKLGRAPAPEELPLDPNLLNTSLTELSRYFVEFSTSVTQTIIANLDAAVRKCHKEAGVRRKNISSNMANITKSNSELDKLTITIKGRPELREQNPKQYEKQLGSLERQKMNITKIIEQNKSELSQVETLDWTTASAMYESVLSLHKTYQEHIITLQKFTDSLLHRFSENPLEERLRERVKKFGAANAEFISKRDSERDAKVNAAIHAIDVKRKAEEDREMAKKQQKLAAAAAAAKAAQSEIDCARQKSAEDELNRTAFREGVAQPSTMGSLIRASILSDDGAGGTHETPQRLDAIPEGPVEHNMPKASDGVIPGMKLPSIDE